MHLLKARLLFLLSTLCLFNGTNASTHFDYLFDLPLNEILKIKVTRLASLFPESELETANTVASVTEDDWQKLGARRITDALSNQPGVMLLPNFLGGDTVGIRGYTQSLSARGIATLLDGIPINAINYNTAQYDTGLFPLGVLDSVEMIRGPGTAVHGSDAFHGVFSLNSFESDVNMHSYDGSFTSNGYHQGAMKYSTEVEDGWRVNFALAAHGQPDQDHQFNYIDVNGSGDEKSASQESQYNNQAFILKFTSDQSQQRYYKWAVYNQHYYTDGAAGLINGLGNGGFSDFPEKDTTAQDTEFQMGSFKMVQKLPNHMRLDVTAYAWRSFFHDIFTGSEPGQTATSDRIDEIHSGGSIVLRQDENPWLAPWVVLFNHRKQKIGSSVESLYFTNASSTARVLPAHGFERQVNSLSLLVKTDLWDSQLHVVLGGRLDEYSDLGTQQHPRLGIIFNPTEDSAVKLLYGEAFRPSAAVEFSGLSAVIQGGGESLKPETIKTTELVYIKHEKQWNTGLTLFHSRWRDGIVIGDNPAPTALFPLKYINQAENSAKGLEASIEWTGSAWSMDANTSYVKSKNDINNEEYAAFPRYIVNLGLGYELNDQKTHVYFKNRFHYDVAEFPVSNSSPNPSDLAHYWRSDLNIDHAYNTRANVYLNIRNLFDRDNRLPSVWESVGGEPGEGFSVMLGLRYDL